MLTYIPIGGGLKTQTCFRCKETKPEYLFSGGYPEPLCQPCAKEDSAKYGESDAPRIKQDWRNLCGRAGNRDGNHPTYKQVVNRMSELEFESWEKKELPIFRCRYGGKVPSVNRLGKDYELGRIELIPKGDNARQRACCLPMFKARLIRFLYSTHSFTLKQLAIRFRTSIATASRVVNYHTHCT